MQEIWCFPAPLVISNVVLLGVMTFTCIILATRLWCWCCLRCPSPEPAVEAEIWDMQTLAPAFTQRVARGFLFSAVSLLTGNNQLETQNSSMRSSSVSSFETEEVEEESEKLISTSSVIIEEEESAVCCREPVAVLEITDHQTVSLRHSILRLLNNPSGKNNCE